MLIKDFLDMVKVLRMLYGVAVAREYFERQISEFGDMQLSVLFNYQSFDKLQTTLEK